MKAMQKKLRDWVAQGFLTEDQERKILSYEDAKGGTSWALMGFLILGAVVIGIGVISLIAANWHLTTGLMKLTGNFTLHAVLVFFAYKFYKLEQWGRFEVILVLMFMLCLGSIGLISQVYHTGGKLFQALQLWTIITFGLFLLSRHKFIPYLWSFAFFGSLSYTFLEATMFRALFHKNEMSLLLLLPLLSFVAALIFRHFAGETVQTKALRFTAVLMGCSSLLIMEQSPLFMIHKQMVYDFQAFLPSYLLGAVSLIFIVVNKNYKSIQKILLVSILALYFLPLHLGFFFIVLSFFMSFISIGTFILLALFMITINERRLFSIFINFVGLRFLVLYFQAFGGLAYTGFGLIISGFLMIGAVFLWKKNLSKITKWAERVMQ